MRFNRHKIDSRNQAAVYACASAAIDEREPFAGEGMDYFKALLLKVSLYTGVWVDTYAINSREFCVQLHVPERPELTDAEVFRRYKELNSPPSAYMKDEFETVEKMFREGDSRLEEWIERKEGQMYDVSAFMKIVKERFAQWFNRKAGRDGPLFKSRFSSTVVESTREWVSGACASIDSLQLLARRMEEQGQVLCTGLGDAASGNELARRGLVRALDGESWEDIEREYQGLIARHCNLDVSEPDKLEPLGEWLANMRMLNEGMEGDLSRLFQRLCGAVMWGSLKAVEMGCEAYLRKERKMRARRKVGLVPRPGGLEDAAVLRMVNRKRRKPPGWV